MNRRKKRVRKIKTKIFWEYTKLYEKLWFTLNIDSDKIFEKIKSFLFLNKEKVYEFDNKKNKNNEFLIKNIEFNKNFRNNQNYIISKLEKKKVFSVSFWREKFFKIVEKYFNIRLFFSVLSLILFFILMTFSIILAFFYLFFSISLIYFTSKLTLNSKFNVLSTFTHNNFAYFKSVFSYWGLIIFIFLILPIIIWLFLSLFSDSILISFNKIWDFYFKNIFIWLAGVFFILLATRFLFKINFFHIISFPFFILLKLILNFYYFINYDKINKTVFKLNIKKYWYMFLKSNFLKKYKDWSFRNEWYLIK